MTIKQFLFLICTFFTLTCAGATEVFYRVKLTVDHSSTGFYSSISPVPIGQKYYALIGIDDSILTSDGIGKFGELLEFVSQVGLTYYSMHEPSDLEGFFGGCAILGCTSDEQSMYGGLSRLFRFDVQGGKISGLYGSAFSHGDANFIDFGYGSVPGKSFQAISRFPGNIGMIDVHLFGTQEFERIPEPHSVALFCVGLLGIFVMRRGRKSGKHRDSPASLT